MADKDPILIIEVDLACHTCYTRIQKVLCKIQVKENIKSISYDTKKNEVTISGSFNPQQLYHKLTCKAGCVIKGHKIPVIETEAEKKKKEEEKKKKEAEEKKKKEEEEKKKKEAEEKKKKEEEKKEAATASANSTVNLQFTKVCIICYPWPCRDPTNHCQQRHRDVDGCGSCGGGGGGGCRQPKPLPPICCPGPPRCGGCGSCGGGGGCWQPKPLPPICCPGQSCRGCNGCRVVHEQKYEYHEYPPSGACIVM